MFRTVAILSNSKKISERFAQAVCAGDCRPIQVNSKYFSVEITLLCATFQDWFADEFDRTRVSSVVTVVSQSDEPNSVPRITLPWLAFEAVVGVNFAADSEIAENWRSACVTRGQEWVSPGLEFGFEFASPLSATAGLLAGDLGGASRILQLLHQTPWPMSSTFERDSSSSNWMMCVGDRMTVAAVLESAGLEIVNDGASAILNTRYFRAQINILLRSPHEFVNEMADLISCEIGVAKPRFCLWCASEAEAGASAAVRAFQLPALRNGLDNAAIEAACYAFPGSLDQMSQQLLMRLTVEPVSLNPETDFSDEEGYFGPMRLREVIECCHWTPCEKENVEITKITTGRVLVGDLAFVGVGVPLEHVNAIATTVLGVTKESSTAVIRSKYTEAVVAWSASVVNVNDLVTTCDVQGLVVIGNSETDANCANLVANLFDGTFSARGDPDTFVDDEKLRFLIADNDDVDGNTKLIDPQFRYCVEIGEGTHEAILERLREALSQCRWTSARPIRPPPHLLYSCEPPPGWSCDASGRTRPTPTQLPQTSDDAELWRLAAEMRQVREATHASDDVKRAEAERLALKFAELVGVDS